MRGAGVLLRPLLRLCGQGPTRGRDPTRIPGDPVPYAAGPRKSRALAGSDGPGGAARKGFRGAFGAAAIKGLAAPCNPAGSSREALETPRLPPAYLAVNKRRWLLKQGQVLPPLLSSAPLSRNCSGVKPSLLGQASAEAGKQPLASARALCLPFYLLKKKIERGKQGRKVGERWEQSPYSAERSPKNKIKMIIIKDRGEKNPCKG